MALIKTCLSLMALMALGWGLSLGASLPPGYDAIYLAPTASPVVVEAAHELARLLERSFGAAPRIRRKPAWGPAFGIHVGPVPRQLSFAEHPLQDEILIQRTPRGLEILGSDNPATAFAVYRFLEDFLGWHAYQPGPLGLERRNPPPDPPPPRGPPDRLLHEQAGFHSRNPDLGRSPEVTQWRHWMGLRERFAYNHALPRLIDWEMRDRHPDLSAADLRRRVVLESVSALEEQNRLSPAWLSVSISPGDAYDFGEWGPDYPWGPKGYFRRWPDWSNHVFAYANAVAAGIQEEWERRHGPGAGPERYLGILAYLNWEDVPDFPLHPELLPYLTFDRSQWYDRAEREDDLANLRAWADKGQAFLGTWDYLFSHGFLIPRSMTAIIKASVPLLHEAGVRAYFAQVSPIWPYDGHTNWLLAKLLWDPQADAEALLEAYFRDFYGPASGPMREFFAQAESLWMEQDGGGWWLRYWKDPWQMALWKESDLQAMEAHLARAEALAAGVRDDEAAYGLSPCRFSERVGQVRAVFTLTRLLHAHQWLTWKGQTISWESANREEVETGLADWAVVLDLREQLVERARALREAVPLAAPAAELDWIFRYDADWTRLPGKSARPVLHDRNFSSVEDPRIWHPQFMDAEGLLRGKAGTGAGYRVENVRRGSLYQLFPARPGEEFSGSLDLETRQSPSAEIYIRLDFFDAVHRLLSRSPRSRIAPTALFGESQRLRVFAKAPEGTAYGRIFIRFYEMDRNSHATLRSVNVHRLQDGMHPAPPSGR